MAIKILLRKDTAANWTTANSILAEGEMGIEKDTKKYKIGDGVTNWNSLAYGFNNDPLAVDISYDNTTSGLAATDVNAAIDELNVDITDEDNSKKYATQLKIVGGKPVLEYEEVI